jgi:diacylglycerol kinase (CTP)
VSVVSDELKRKAFHMFTLLYAALFVWGGRERSLLALGSAFLVVALVEAFRLRHAAFNDRLLGLFGGIHREKESRRPSGILWTLGGAFLTIWLVPHPDVVLTSLWYLAVGDAAAALVGKKWGRIRIGDKSLEGSVACFLSCWAAGAAFLDAPGGNLPEAAVGAFTAALLEALPLPIDDNLWIPLVSGLVLTFLR